MTPASSCSGRFNAAYAHDVADDTSGERTRSEKLFRYVVNLDFEHRIYNAVWKRDSPHEIRILP